MRKQTLTPKRVLHLIDSPGPGGAESICVDLIAGLQARFHAGIAAPPHGSWVERQLLGTPTETVAVDSAGRLRLRQRSALLATSRCDIVQAHLLSAGVDAALLALRHRVPAVVTFHGPPDFSAEGIRKRLYSLLLKQRRIRVVTVSRALAKIASDWLALDGQRIDVIPNGVELAAVPQDRSWTFRRSLGISDSAIVLGAVGNFRVGKRHDLLVETLIRLRATGVDAHAIIIGEHAEPMHRELMTLAQLGGVASALHLPGFRTDVADCLPDFDVFLSTSDGEGFSLALVQAMGARVPVIATRSGGPQEILEEGRWGSLVPTGSADALLAAVQALLSDPDLVHTRRREAHAHAMALYTRPSMIDAYERLYAEMLNDRHSANAA